jgi:very-short-patch-repair endonuclease
VRVLSGGMDPKTTRAALATAKPQHGVIALRQLFGLGLNSDAVKHLVATGFLHRVFRGVYAVGRPDLTRYGRWLAAVLSCGPRAVLSHDSAAALWRICDDESGGIEVVVRGSSGRKSREGIVVHSRRWLDRRHVTRQRGIPVTTPLDTLIDIAPRKSRKRLEAAINNADNLGLVKEHALREALAHERGRPGVPALRTILDPATFVLTDSELERLFLPIARAAGLPKPETQRYLGSDRVDFFWADLELVVEADSLTYHRTAVQQTTDLVRDHKHVLAERRPLRFSHHQIAREPGYVQGILEGVRRLLTSAF